MLCGVAADLAVLGIAGWRSACWFNVALHAVSFALFALFYHPRAVENPSRLSVLKRIINIDLVGSTLLACGIVPL